MLWPSNCTLRSRVSELFFSFFDILARKRRPSTFCSRHSSQAAKETPRCSDPEVNQQKRENQVLSRSSLLSTTSSQAFHSLCDLKLSSSKRSQTVERENRRLLLSGTGEFSRNPDKNKEATTILTSFFQQLPFHQDRASRGTNARIIHWPTAPSSECDPRYSGGSVLDE